MVIAAASSRMKAQLAPQQCRHEAVPGATKLLSMLSCPVRSFSQQPTTGAPRATPRPSLGL